MIATYQLETSEKKSEHLRSLMGIPSINPRPYDPTEEYARLDFIDHPDHGVGFVLESVSKSRIRVFFQSGEREVDHCLLR